MLLTAGGVVILEGQLVMVVMMMEMGFTAVLA